MAHKNKQQFTRKGGGGSLYKWSPTNIITCPDGIKKSDIGRQKFCNAIKYSLNGEDSITKYVSDKVLVDDKTQYTAYVECGYVE